MSPDNGDQSDEREPLLSVQSPADVLAGHPTTAYFWGHVAASGAVSDGSLEVVTSDERSAETLSAIAGGDVARETTSREYAHDTSITRTAEEYTLTLDGDRGSEEGLFGRSTTAGLPVDGRGNYRFGAFSSHDRELLRGLLEGCGTVCFKSSQGTVGISFVHDDRDLLETVRDLLGDCPVDPPLGDLSETSSGGYWFGVDDDAAPELGRWLYDDCEETGLYAPSRRRKLERSLEQAEGLE
ncbi:cobalamin biosynthesis protein [Natrialba swarupiae]|uniref:Cobalamin biosynthesis protein n=1 Tax=Natrialba swarupiae TaxID=2448032 RepID=A0A5D5AGK4_9EURY|nr:cobalamin biosynthesis protein [Natrialba swarupiae]TYT60958.1 cobalamin biosynthesis protein [Natrialba swarupiae]